MTVGDFIKTIAKEKGTSAAKIERDLGFSNGYIGTSRDSSFPYDRLVKIAEYLDVSPEYLWSRGESASNSFSGPVLSDDESALLVAFRQLDEYDRGQALGIIKGLLQKLDALEEERQAIRTEISLSKNKKSPSSFSREAFREGLQVFLEGFDFDNSDRMVERILDAFVRKVVKTNEKILVELNLTGVDPLELEDLIEFDQNSDWWSSLPSGRTLICGTAAVLVIEYAA